MSEEKGKAAVKVTSGARSKDTSGSKKRSADSSSASSSSAASKKKKKSSKKKKKDVVEGVPLFFGSTHFSASVDVKEVEKLIVTPSKIAAMAGRKVSKVVSGPGALHFMMITKQGSVFSFGKNEHGQCGLGDTKTRSAPRKIDCDHKIVDAACGKGHTLFLTEEGKVLACGNNRSGQLGLGSQKIVTKESPTMILRDFEGKIIKIACGGEFSMVLNEFGQLFAFGHPDFGCLGNNTDGKFFVSASKLSFHFEFAPIKVSGFCDKDPDAVAQNRDNKLDFLPLQDVYVVDVKCGPQHTMVMTDDYRVFTWGFGGYGRLGHNSNADELVPRLVMHLKPTNPHTFGAKAIYAGGSSCFVETNSKGRMYFWGQMKSSGEATMYPKPYEEFGGQTPNHMAIGMKHVVMAADGTSTWSMGSSPCYGELGYGADVERRSSTHYQQVGPLNSIPIVGVACGIYQSLVLGNNDTKEARKALQELPTLGTVTNACLICKKEDNEDDMMLCDKCDRPVHFGCAGLEKLPGDDEEFFCKFCKGK